MDRSGGRESRRSFVDAQLWHACAGSMVQMPSLNARVFYFPQGHLEHATSQTSPVPATRTPSAILCRVAAVRFLAEQETDEVYARIGLVPLSTTINHHPLYAGSDGDGDGGYHGLEKPGGEKPTSFAKTLTQSDANNGGGFSVPRYCAETIFPRLDYSAEPPVQTVCARDIHGEMWKFRHIYRGTPRRHLLTTGWSAFVNQKKLVAADSIVFLRALNGELFVGIRRAKRGGAGFGISSSPTQTLTHFRGFPQILKEGGGRLAEGVMEAVTLAAAGRAFEVVYYPRKGTPEFIVREGVIRAAMKTQWAYGMRFKMPFETEDSSRISWFMGTIAGVKVVDPVNWPGSPWRILQVVWDEPDLLPNVKCVNPWLVELISSIPTIHHLSPYSPPRKRLRFPHNPDFPFDGHFLPPSFPINPFRSNRTTLCSTGMQGARQTQFEVLLSTVHVNPSSGSNLPHLQQGGLVASCLHGKTHQHPGDPNNRLFISGQIDANEENINSCILTIGGSLKHEPVPEKTEKPTQFLLFGQPILIERPISSNSSSSGVTVSELSPYKAASAPLKTQTGMGIIASQTDRFQFETVSGHCKVFMESEDVGRSINLCTIDSYEELYGRLGDMFGEEKSGIFTRVLYHDSSGAVNRTGDVPFSEFRRIARRLTILANPGSKDLDRSRLTGMWNIGNGLTSSNKVGPLSIPA